MNTEVTQKTNTGGRSLVTKFANRFEIDPSKLLPTLCGTAFQLPGGRQPTQEQMIALLIVADQHKLNPFTKEIYAFEDKHKGIVPIVSVDGWARIINEHPQFDGMDFDEGIDSDATGRYCTCKMYRKDRSHPVSITEWMTECVRTTGPWQSHPRRMLRHKAMIQCARMAFSFAGIYDQDEGERIIEARETDIQHGKTDRQQSGREEKPAYPDEKFEQKIQLWEQLVLDGERNNTEILAIAKSRYVLTEKQHDRIMDLGIEDGEIIEEESNEESSE